MLARSFQTASARRPARPFPLSSASCCSVSPPWAGRARG
jgi:hypothetical protein